MRPRLPMCRGRPSTRPDGVQQPSPRLAPGQLQQPGKGQAPRVQRSDAQGVRELGDVFELVGNGRLVAAGDLIAIGPRFMQTY